MQTINTINEHLANGFLRKPSVTQDVVTLSHTAGLIFLLVKVSCSGKQRLTQDITFEGNCMKKRARN